jgi:hypothetical protein
LQKDSTGGNLKIGFSNLSLPNFFITIRIDETQHI